MAQQYFFSKANSCPTVTSNRWLPLTFKFESTKQYHKICQSCMNYLNITIKLSNYQYSYQLFALVSSGAVHYNNSFVFIVFTFKIEIFTKSYIHFYCYSYVFWHIYSRNSEYTFWCSLHPLYLRPVNFTIVSHDDHVW